MKFNRLQETLFTMGKNRSETVVYTVYLRQCYYDILGTDRLWMIY